MSIDNSNLNFLGNHEEFSEQNRRADAAWAVLPAGEPPASEGGAREFVQINIPPAASSVPRLEKRKSVCERAGDFFTSVAPLFSLRAKERNRKKLSVQQANPAKKFKSAGVDSALFLQTIGDIKKDKGLVALFKKLPQILQDELFLVGTESEQAELIRVWMTGVQERLQQVTRLDLNGCKLTAIPEEIHYFTGLAELDLSNNEITQIDPILALTNLTRLNLANNQITRLPDLRCFSRLADLSLQQNRIVPTEDLLDQLPIEAISPSLALDLQKQNVPGGIVLPERIKASRQDIDLITIFSKLPSDLQAQLPLTETLSVSEKAQAIRTWILGAPKADLEKVTRLDLSDCNLYTIPREIGHFPNLKELDLSHNHISDIAVVANLSKLERLIISYNEISQIPHLPLPFLTGLSIHSNQLRVEEGMLEKIPETARKSFILGVQVQDLPGKVTLPDSWRTVRFDALPDELIGLVTHGLISRETLLVSKTWKQESYQTLLDQYRASFLLRRFIDPSTLPGDPKPAVLQIQGKIMELLNDAGLEIPFTLDPQKLEQAIHDRSLILLYRKGLYRNSIEGNATEQARLIREWMEENQERLARETHLFLGDLKLYVVPEEIRYFTRLEYLNLDSNCLVDATALGSLTSLTSLRLADNQIQNIEALGSLVNLNELNFYGNQIVDITPLGFLTNLTRLNLSINQIQRIEALKSLVNLNELIIYGNQIVDITPLGFLTKLTQLNLSRNRIQRIEALQLLINLNELYLEKNQIENIKVLRFLIKLTNLNISSNKIENVEGLSVLFCLVGLNISYNLIENVSCLGSLNQLVDLSIHCNKIRNVDGLGKLANLKKLLIFGNSIEDVSPLAPLERLEQLWISGNRIKDIQPLAALRQLKDLSIEGNYVQPSKVDPLQFPEAVRQRLLEGLRDQHDPSWERIFHPSL